MTRAEALALLRHQCARGPLPRAGRDLGSWFAVLRASAAPLCELAIPREACAPFRGAGVEVAERDGTCVARVPADGDAIDRALELCGAPPLAHGAAAALLAALEREAAEETPPALSLPLRIKPAKASSLGWSPELVSLTVLISNATLRESDGATLAAGRGPVVALCADYERALTSLDPPAVAGYPLSRARDQGMPTVRLHPGWPARPLRLEATSKLARAAAGRLAARARAVSFLGQLDAAWKRTNTPTLEVGWPVYRPQGSRGPLLDAVVGRPLPEMES